MSNDVKKGNEKEQQSRPNETRREIVTDMQGCCTIRVEVVCCKPGEDSSCC